MLARILYIAVAITVLGAFPRPGTSRGGDARSGPSGAPTPAASVPRPAPQR
jgi:hypothetical protein